MVIRPPVALGVIAAAAAGQTAAAPLAEEEVAARVEVEEGVVVLAVQEVSQAAAAAAEVLPLQEAQVAREKLLSPIPQWYERGPCSFSAPLPAA